MEQMLTAFIVMCIAHVICDYPLQGDFLSKAKNPIAPLPGVPWYQAMGAHCLMHGGAVWLITGLWWAGVAEFVAHWFIDTLKCTGAISFNTDQILHTSCKIVWIVLAILIGTAIQ